MTDQAAEQRYIEEQTVKTWEGRTAVQPRDAGAVERLVAELSESLDRLHGRIGDLSQRAASVLVTPEDTASADVLAVARTPVRSELAGRLAELVDRADSANYRVGELIARLDL